MATANLVGTWKAVITTLFSRIGLESGFLLCVAT